MKAITYRRVSTLGQVDGEGLGVQAEKIQAWCKYQHVQVLEEHEDAGLSGATMNRPGLQAALASALELGKDGAFVVARIDRLGRNSIEVQVVLKRLIDAGVRVVAIADGIDSESGMGSSLLRLLTTILSSFAEMERDLITSRLLDGKDRARREGRVYASEPHLGLRVADDGRTLVSAPRELEAIQRARVLRDEGRSYRSIARILDREGLHPRRSSRWQPAVVRKMVLRGYQVATCQAA